MLELQSVMPIYKGILSNKTGSYQVAVLNDFMVFEIRVGDFLFRGIEEVFYN